MKIEFFYIENGSNVPSAISDNWYFVMNDEVYRDNEKCYESQSSVIGFDDCIEKCPHIGWRAIRS